QGRYSQCFTLTLTRCTEVHCYPQYSRCSQCLTQSHTHCQELHRGALLASVGPLLPAFHTHTHCQELGCCSQCFTLTPTKCTEVLCYP
ncbi:hypothetical protein NDU88_000387, partial [Pleurodeles waltl]